MQIILRVYIFRSSFVRRFYLEEISIGKFSSITTDLARKFSPPVQGIRGKRRRGRKREEEGEVRGDEAA